ncbi:organic hydroperoxide resistance protein [Nesterenkonia massiliensis]|uniref:organic hydroperoxide resistance protein n=1 Tax=Nesterenkonia massiliensis TaxID=1232429 RepID=UPI000426DEB7|nr:organic hydroperoxide resistance protein [Nesterenkonia massiliensis]
MAVEVLYTAEALATGDGRNGRTKTADGTVDFQLAAPEALGGSGQGANPEQLFAAGYAACFHGALRKIAGDSGVDVTDSAVGVKASIGKDDDGGFGLAVEIEVLLPHLDKEQAQELGDKAHAFCPYSKATRGNIDVKVTVTDD